MKLLDSNVLIAYFNTDDQLHAQAVTLAVKDPVINELVFAEVANVLEKRVSNQSKVMTAVKQIYENLPLEFITEAHLAEGVRLFMRFFPRISLTDSLLLAQAKRLDWTVVTFDERLQTAALQEGVNIVP